MEEFDFKYKCKGCGQCCKNWLPARYNPTIVDENGNCIYLDLKTNLCTIYNNRPDWCRAEKRYKDVYKNIMSFEEYLYKLKIGCDGLIEINQRRKNND